MRGNRIGTMLADSVDVDVVVLDGARDAVPGRAVDADVLVVTASLRRLGNITALRQLAARFPAATCRIFVIERSEQALVVQAYALGATDVIFAPFQANTLLAKLPRIGQSAISARSSAVMNCASAFQAIFAEMATDGRRLDLQRACDATRQIIDCVSNFGLTAWLDDVRRHHEGTFQHCLLVAGIAVDFGISLQFSGADLLNVGLAATLHDVGKARISLAILDKPGRLEPKERAQIEQHPSLGYESIKSLELSADVADAVLHHHEFLDGSGYPDHLTAAAIPDITRMITVADIFAALIEQRSYAAAMPRPQAYDVLEDMAGKLERPLVRAFAPVALRR
jgi:putative nucleotidyltransferase with HDIG domain